MATPEYDEKELDVTMSPAERFMSFLASRNHSSIWNPNEIACAALDAAIALYALAAVVGGIVESLGFHNIGITPVVLDADEWATPILAAVLLGSTLLAWHEVSSWSEKFNYLAFTNDMVEASDDDFREIVARMFRSRFLTSCAAALSIVVAAGSIAVTSAFASEIPGQTGGPEWGSFIRVAGSAIAVTVLSIACIKIAIRSRREIQLTMESVEDDVSNE